MYTEEVIKHFKNPRNVGEIRNASGVGKAGNKICGDLMWIYIKVENINGKEIISDIKFKTLGCVAAIATSSKITELAKGKTIKEALNITKNDVVKSLGGLPPIKVHCSMLATDALAEAIYDYLKRNKRKIPEELEKRHNRIIKELNNIEKRYKEFLDFQKKVMK